MHGPGEVVQTFAAYVLRGLRSDGRRSKYRE
jgi:hypothetical protein